MPRTNTSRLEGLTTSVAVKAPCRVATTAAITLLGLQTIDGVTVAANDRVLVKNQSSTVQNGIYLAQANEWVRAKDFDGTRDVVDGTYVFITDGSTQHDTNWRVSATNPVRIGTTAITFGVTSPMQGLPGSNGEDGEDGAQGNPGSPAGQYPVGLFEDISGQIFPESAVYIRTNAYRTPQVPYQNSGAGWYIYDTAVDADYVAANPYTSTISANGRGYRLDLEQDLTWEMLGAPTTGKIFAGSITGTTLTDYSSLSTTLAAGQTITASGGTGAVAPGTKILSGSGTTWTVNISQNVGVFGVTSVPMVANDSFPYVGTALKLGKRGLLSTGPHWFSQCIAAQGYPVNWYGPQGYVDSAAGYLATWYFPAGYGGIVCAPTNLTVSPEGDVTLAGNNVAGGISGSSFSRIAIQIGNGALPATTVNHRPAVALYSQVKWSDFRISGSDGNGLLIFGNVPECLADKCSVKDFIIQNCYDNGIETLGGDGNTCDIENGIVSSVGASGVYEHGFLGNGYRLIQSQTTGLRNCVVRRSNNLYYSIQDGNINHDPLSSPAYWQLWKAGAGTDSWSSSTTYRVGAAYRTLGGGNGSTFDTCYSEGDALPALFQSASGGVWLTTVVGGLHGAGVDFTNGGCNVWGGLPRSGAYIAYGGSAKGPGGLSSYGFETTSVSTFFTGYFANNKNPGPGSATAAGYDSGINDVWMARFGGKYSQQSGHGGYRIGHVSVWNTSDTRVDMQFWDAQALTTAPFTDNSISNGDPALRWKNDYSVNLRPGAGTVIWTSGTGTPEAAVTAPIGSLFTRTDGGANTTLYVKESGAGNTGWIAK